MCGLAWLCEVETSVKLKGALSEQRNAMEYSVSSLAEDRYKKWPGDLPGKEKCKQQGIFFSTKLPVFDGYDDMPLMESQVIVLQLFQKHIFCRLSHLFANLLGKFSEDLTCMP